MAALFAARSMLATAARAMAAAMTLCGLGIVAAIGGIAVRHRAPRVAVPGSAGGALSVSTGRRALLLAVVTYAVVIDNSKTSTIGFAIPGMRADYGLSAVDVSLLPT